MCSIGSELQSRIGQVVFDHLDTKSKQRLTRSLHLDGCLELEGKVLSVQIGS